MSITEPQPAAPKPGRPWFQYSLRTLLLVVTLGAVLCSWLAVKMKEAEEQRIARLQSLVAAARIAQRDWEQAQEADRTVPRSVRRGELRRLQLLSERAALNVKAESIEEHDNETLRKLDTRRAIIDLELSELEIEWAKITSSWPEAQRLGPARQAAICTINLLQGMGPKAKDSVPLLVAALGEPELDSFSRSALEQIDPAVLKGAIRLGRPAKSNLGQRISPAADDTTRR